MATRMQQRRGLASQWISTNSGNGPILAPGEIGFESDTNKFKIGDGVNHWVDLDYFTTDSAEAITQQINTAISGLVDGAPGLLNTLNELAAAINDDPSFFTTIATNLSNHESDTTDVHGILDTNELATKEYVTQEIGNATGDYPELAGEGLVWDGPNQQFAVNTLAIQERVTGVSDTEIGYLSGVTSDIQTQLNAKLESADLDEAAQEAVNTALVAGIGLDKTYDDLANTITIDIDSTVATKTYADEAADAAQTAAELTASGALSTHSSDTTSVHGITDTAELATKTFAAELLTNATKTNVTITGDKNGLTITAENGVADSNTDNLTEGSTNKYFTDERAQDAVGNSVGTGLTYTDSTGEIKVTPNTYDAYGSASAVAGDLSTHASDTTDIHGIADTSLLATKAYADAAVAAVVDAAPASLNTLKELATALADDANYATTVNNALAAKAPLASPAFSGTVTGITKAMVGLGSVDNTADTAKPVSDATQTALNLKAPIDSPTFTGTIGGITKSMVGLGNVDNTSDANKPVSTAAQSALDLKAPLANPTFTGTVSGITKSMVGLANVDNTSDASKPVSTATQTALDAKASLAGATFTGSVEVDGNLVVDGDFTVNGTNFAASATSITIEDNLVQLAHQNAGNTVDLGVVVGYNDGAAKHAGIVRDVSTDKWKLFKGVTTEPTTTVDFTQGSLDNLQVAGFEATSATIGNVSNEELQHLNGVTSGVQSQLDAKLETSTASSTYATIANVDLKAPLANPTFTGTVAGVTKAHVGLGNVDNTSDANKPVSSATQTALDLKAPLASPTFTGTVTLPTGTVTSGMILDGTIVDGDISSSAAIAQSKVSGLTTDLGLKAPLESPALTGTPTAPTAAAGTNTTQVATTAFVGTAVADLVASAPSALNTLNELATALGNDASFSTTVTNSLAAKAPLNSPTFTGTVSGISKSMVGLANVDNTSDVSKPISNATQTELDLKAPLANPTFTGTVAGVTKAHVGLGNVDNTADSAKPVSTAQQTALNAKAPLASPTFTGTVDFTGATVTGIPVTSAATPTALGTVYGNVLTDNSSTEFGQTSLGYNSGSPAYYSTAIGSGAMGSGQNSTVIGYGAVVTGDSSTVVGKGAFSQYHDNSTAIGAQASTSASNQIVLGNGYVTNFKIPGLGIDWTSSTVPGASPMTTGTYTLTSDTVETIDSVEFGTWSTIEYTLSLKQYLKVRSSKIIVQTNGTDVDMSEYAITETGGSMTGVSVTAILGGMASAAALQIVVTDASITTVDVKFSKVVL
jgi:hypothetical protein